MLNMIAETSGRPFQSTFVPRTAPSTSYASASRVHRKKCSRDVLVSCSQNASNGRGGSDLARMETAVPVDQRPATQLKELREAQLYSWAVLESQAYLKRLGILFLGSFALLGGPIAYQTFDPMKQTAEFFLSGAVGAGFVVSLAVLRIYLGWSYVGDRLLSAAVAYEETGWYDGQTFVKPPEVLTRDRLLGMYEVKPALSRLKTTLLGTGGVLLLSGSLLFGIIASSADADGVYGRGAARVPRRVSNEGIIYSKTVKSLQDLRDDDTAAAEEAEAQGGVPGYCGDRFYRAFAGGSMCAKFDSRP